MRARDYALIAVLLLAAAGYYAYQNVLPVAASARVTVTDETGSPVNALVQLFANNQLVAEANASQGVALLEAAVPRGAVLMARAEATGFLPARSGFRGAAVKLVLERETLAKPRVDFVIATDLDAIRGKYGAEYAEAVSEKMDSLAEAAEADDLTTRVVLLENDYASVGAAVNDLTPSYLLIVGGPRIVAFEEFATPLADAGGAFAFLARSDPRVPSDNAYGMLAAARYECVECHPDVAVGRLPDGWEEESDSPLLLGLLDAAIAAHASPPALEEMASVVSMDSYGEHLKHLVYEELGNEIVDAPPAYYADASGIEGGFQTIINAVNGANALFFSLHGSNPPGTQVYSASDGAGEYYVLTRGLPEVEGMDYTGKIVLTDACYGANPYRLENESLPLLFLNNGALAFVGSTTSALANRKVSSQEFDDEAEILALGSSTAFHYRILRGLRDGERIGDAVKAARSEMLAGVPADELTAVQYVLYGDPTLKTNG